MEEDSKYKRMSFEEAIWAAQKLNGFNWCNVELEGIVKGLVIRPSTIILKTRYEGVLVDTERNMLPFEGYDNERSLQMTNGSVILKASSELGEPVILRGHLVKKGLIFVKENAYSLHINYGVFRKHLF